MPSKFRQGCMLSKTTMPYPKVSEGRTLVTRPFEILHADPCAPIVLSVGRAFLRQFRTDNGGELMKDALLNLFLSQEAFTVR